MSRRHNRRRKEKRRERIQRENERRFTPVEPSTDTEAPPRRRLFSLGVRGGWDMEFTTSGVHVPFDPDAKEAPPLEELTLGAMLAGQNSKGGD